MIRSTFVLESCMQSKHSNTTIIFKAQNSVNECNNFRIRSGSYYGYSHYGPAVRVLLYGYLRMVIVTDLHNSNISVKQ